MALRADLQDMKERGPEKLTDADIRRLMSTETAQLVAKAGNVATVEHREAQRAEHIARRAVEEAHRDAGRASSDPESLKDVAVDREVARVAESIASRERLEANAAQAAAASIAANPTKPLDPNQQLTERLAQIKREQEELQKDTDKASPQKM